MSICVRVSTCMSCIHICVCDVPTTGAGHVHKKAAHACNIFSVGGGGGGGGVFNNMG